MFAENRRAERREDILDILEAKGYEISDGIMDYKMCIRDRYYFCR